MSISASQAVTSGHLCVLVHGLWGNPGHLNQVADGLRDQFPSDDLHIFAPTRNSYNLTYDGIELGGERVVQEVEEKLESLAGGGHEISKISIIGYSLGGLIARYAVGLLYSKGWFDKLQAVNFTTFATPHLGVRTPRIGVPSNLWNYLGARTLSISGRQLFLVDKFRDTNRPLLAVLADSDSIFIRGLSSFKNRSLYGNIINDRSVPYYTSLLAKTDPYVELDIYNVKYVPGYEPVIIDDTNPLTLKDSHVPPSFYDRSSSFVRRLPMLAFFTVFLPFGASIYLINAAVQSVQSQRRIRAHESGRTGFDFGLYRIPLLINNAQHASDRVFENVANSQGEDFLPSSYPTDTEKAAPDSASENGSIRKPQTPTLALHEDQFTMIRNLEDLGFQKYPVHIHKATHSHAAIIRRMKQGRFDDGKVVIKHWAERFEL